MNGTFIRELVERERAGRRLLLIGIGGFGCAGKSTLAAELPEAQLVPTDGFWDGAGFDLARLRVDILEPLLDGKPGRAAIREWASGEEGELVVEPWGIVVVEGVCALHRALRDAYSLRVWLDVPRETRLARAVARDGEGSRQPWVEKWMPREQRYFDLDRPDLCADTILDGNGNPVQPHSND
ncbi:MAG: hypothetical protein U0R50_05520 [Gaiellales bacterium]